MPKKVFISYAREDLETAKKLYFDLKAGGFDPWLDEKNLLAGQNWRQVIPQELRKTGYVLILMSTISVKKRGYVQAEQRMAMEMMEEFPLGDIFLIPIRIDNCETPFRLEGINWVDLFPNENYEAALDKIIRGLNAPRVSEVLLPAPTVPIPNKPPLIYISYATIDNESGWIDALAKNLRSELAQRIGSRDRFSLFLDKSADSEVPNLPPEVLAHLEKAAFFIPVVSPSYVASDRCKRELNTFIRRIDGPIDGCVRVIERLRIDDDKRPASLYNIRPYRLWQYKEGKTRPRILGHPSLNPERDSLYFDQVFDLSDDLAEMIKFIVTKSTHDQCPLKSFGTWQTIFLADVTEDLLGIRDQLERYLVESGFRVFPEQEIPQTDSERYQTAVYKMLEGCHVFVQLLSEQAGKTRTLAEGICRLQYEAAKKAGKVILQWRNPNLKVNGVLHSGQKRLLSKASVLAVAISEFKEQVLKRARFKPIKYDASTSATFSSGALVFLNADKTDKHHAEQVAELMAQREVAYAFPVWEKDGPDLLRDMEDFILNSDGLIVIYGNVHNTWVKKQLLYCRNLIYRREEPLKAIAVYEGPPPNKPAINFTIPGLKLIQCHERLDEQKFVPFFEALANGGAL